MNTKMFNLNINEYKNIKSVTQNEADQILHVAQLEVFSVEDNQRMVWWQLILQTVVNQLLAYFFVPRRPE